MALSRDLEIMRRQILKELEFQAVGSLAGRPLSSLKAPEDLQVDGRIRFPKGVDNMWNNKSSTMSKCLVPDNTTFLENGLRKLAVKPSASAHSRQHEEVLGDSPAAMKLSKKKSCRCPRCGRLTQSASLLHETTGDRCEKLGEHIGTRLSPTAAASLTNFLQRLKQNGEGEGVVLRAEPEALAGDKKAAVEAAQVAGMPEPPATGRSLGSRQGSKVLSRGGSLSLEQQPGRTAASTTWGAGNGSRGERGGTGEARRGGGSSWNETSSGWTAASAPKRVVVPQMLEWSPLILTDGYRPQGVPGPNAFERIARKKVLSEPPWATSPMLERQGYDELRKV